MQRCAHMRAHDLRETGGDDEPVVCSFSTLVTNSWSLSPMKALKALKAIELPALSDRLQLPPCVMEIQMGI